jgi:LacI family transcriptional regulator/LacI family purine nucleotide synthesis repressor
LSLGVLVPGSVAVVGFDGFDFPSAPRFRLTTIRAPWARVARDATHILNSLIGGEDVPALTTVPVEFIRGNTT